VSVVAEQSSHEGNEEVRPRNNVVRYEKQITVAHEHVIGTPHCLLTPQNQGATLLEGRSQIVSLKMLCDATKPPKVRHLGSAHCKQPLMDIENMKPESRTGDSGSIR
jgi:hypothetical protein